jgi:hypothetical protein
MSIGNRIPYERSARGTDATGSLVFDQERKRTPRDEAPRETGKRPPKAKKQA